MISALLVHGVPIECINQAAVVYHVPAALIISVLSVEGGRVGMASPNNNGTYDYGPMQINTIWIDKLKPYGYSLQQIQYDACTNVMVGAWILGTSIANSPDLWRGIGGYHSDTPPLNQAYQYKIWNVYEMLAHYLSNTAVPPTATPVVPQTATPPK